MHVLGVAQTKSYAYFETQEIVVTLVVLMSGTGNAYALIGQTT